MSPAFRIRRLSSAVVLTTATSGGSGARRKELAMGFDLAGRDNTGTKTGQTPQKQAGQPPLSRYLSRDIVPLCVPLASPASARVYFNTAHGTAYTRTPPHTPLCMRGTKVPHARTQKKCACIYVSRCPVFMVPSVTKSQKRPAGTIAIVTRVCLGGPGRFQCAPGASCGRFPAWICPQLRPAQFAGWTRPVANPTQ